MLGIANHNAKLSSIRNLKTSKSATVFTDKSGSFCRLVVTFKIIQQMIIRKSEHVQLRLSDWRRLHRDFFETTSHSSFRNSPRLVDLSLQRLKDLLKTKWQLHCPEVARKSGISLIKLQRSLQDFSVRSHLQHICSYSPQGCRQENILTTARDCAETEWRLAGDSLEIWKSPISLEYISTEIEHVPFHRKSLETLKMFLRCLRD